MAGGLGGLCSQRPIYVVSAADVRDVHSIPLVEVMTRSPNPEKDTATNRLFPKVTEYQSLSAAAVRDVHVIPLEEVMTRAPGPEKDTATKILFPKATERH